METLPFELVAEIMTRTSSKVIVRASICSKPLRAILQGSEFTTSALWQRIVATEFGPLLAKLAETSKRYSAKQKPWSERLADLDALYRTPGVVLHPHGIGRHDSAVMGFDYVPTSDQLISWSNDNSIAFWDSTNRTKVKSEKPHSGHVFSVQYDIDLNILVSGSSDTNVKVFDFTTGELKHTLKGHSNWVLSVVILTKRKLIASGAYDNTVRLWSVETGECVQIFKAHADRVMSITGSPLLNAKGQEKYLVSASNDENIFVWDLDTNKVETVLHGHTKIVSTLSWTRPDIMVSGGYDKKIVVWDMDQRVKITSWDAHDGTVGIVILMGELILSGGERGEVRVWNLEGRMLRSIANGTSTVWCAYPLPDAIVCGESVGNINAWSLTAAIPK